MPAAFLYKLILFLHPKPFLFGLPLVSSLRQPKHSPFTEKPYTFTLVYRVLHLCAATVGVLYFGITCRLFRNLLHFPRSEAARRFAGDAPFFLPDFRDNWSFDGCLPGA
jgi:hypothetical protein